MRSEHIFQATTEGAGLVVEQIEGRAVISVRIPPLELTARIDGPEALELGRALARRFRSRKRGRARLVLLDQGGAT